MKKSIIVSVTAVVGVVICVCLCVWLLHNRNARVPEYSNDTTVSESVEHTGPEMVLTKPQEDESLSIKDEREISGCTVYSLTGDYSDYLIEAVGAMMKEYTVTECFSYGDYIILRDGFVVMYSNGVVNLQELTRSRFKDYVDEIDSLWETVE